MLLSTRMLLLESLEAQKVQWDAWPGNSSAKQRCDFDFSQPPPATQTHQPGAGGARGAHHSLPHCFSTRGIVFPVQWPWTLNKTVCTLSKHLEHYVQIEVFHIKCWYTFCLWILSRIGHPYKASRTVNKINYSFKYWVNRTIYFSFVIPISSLTHSAFAAQVQDCKHQVIQKEHVLLILLLILSRFWIWTDFQRTLVTCLDPAQNNSFLMEKQEWGQVLWKENPNLKVPRDQQTVMATGSLKSLPQLQEKKWFLRKLPYHQKTNTQLLTTAVSHI